MSLRSRLAYQSGSVALMGVQGLVVPWLVGLESFGQQMLALSPVLLGQALFETSVQWHANAPRGGQPRLVDIGFVAASFASVLCVMSVAFLLTGVCPAVPDLVLIGPYLVATLAQAIAFAASRSDIAARGVCTAAVGYAIGLLVAIRWTPGSEVAVALLVATGGSLVVQWSMLHRAGLLAFGRETVHPLAVLAAVSYRMPAATAVAGATILLGVLGIPSETIGRFRIVTAVAGAARFGNLVPLAAVQVAIDRWLQSVDRRANRRLVFEFLIGVVAYALCAALLFPVVFERVYGGGEVNGAAMGAVCMMVLIQPASYAVAVAMRPRPVGVIVVTVASAAAMQALFALGMRLSNDPAASLGMACSATVASLLLVVAATRLRITNRSGQRCIRR